MPHSPGAVSTTASISAGIVRWLRDDMSGATREYVLTIGKDEMENWAFRHAEGSFEVGIDPRA
jgi:hypothetical protein